MAPTMELASAPGLPASTPGRQPHHRAPWWSLPACSPVFSARESAGCLPPPSKVPPRCSNAGNPSPSPAHPMVSSPQPPTSAFSPSFLQVRTRAPSRRPSSPLLPGAHPFVGPCCSSRWFGVAPLAPARRASLQTTADSLQVSLACGGGAAVPLVSRVCRAPSTVDVSRFLRCTILTLIY